MKGIDLKLGALVGTITSLPVMALLYLADQLAGLPFVPFDIFDWLARVLPGNLVTAGIDAIVEIINAANLSNTSRSAKIIEQIFALLLFIIIGGLLGMLVAWAISQRQKSPLQQGAVLSTLLFIIIILIEISLNRLEPLLASVVWLGFIFVGWGVTQAYTFTQLMAQPENQEFSATDRAARREIILRLAASSTAIALGGWALSKLVRSPEPGTGANQSLAEPLPTLPSKVTTQAAPTPTARQSTANAARETFPPAPGTRPELTSNENFYRIDINAQPPTIDQEQWALEIAGLFERPKNMSLEDLMTYPAITQPITLSCISNRIGGDLIGTSNWTGLRLRDLLADLGLRPEARSLTVEAYDGFFETVVMEDMLDPRTLLVYGMNGETLPTEHGFPLRIYIPDRYGMKQPKWITRITAVGDEPEGYWVRRGWSREARPQIVSVIDTIADKDLTEAGLIPIGGIAWAGERGIQKVELQFNDGPWVETNLRIPPLSPLTWVQWRLDWQASPGVYTVRVRAIDGLGNLQIAEESPIRPNGATGYHSQRIRI